MPKAHAILSPSSAKRWFKCPGSAKLVEEKGRPTFSPASQRGTLAHAWLEYFLNEYHSGGNPILYDPEFCPEDIKSCVDQAINFILDKTDFEFRKDVYVEKRFTYKSITEELFGTCDLAFRTPRGIYIIDYKHGKMPISVENNEQLLIYAVGYIHTFNFTLPRDFPVTLCIIQPNGGGIKTLETTLQDILKFRDEQLKPAVKAALEENPRFQINSECHFCPVQYCCPLKNIKEENIMANAKEALKALDCIPEELF